MEAEKFCLQWNDFADNISGAFSELREEKDFFDVTLACEDQQIQAHKLILSASSPFFRNVLRRNPHQHPLLYLKGVKYRELVSVLNFMYLGEVNVAKDDLNLFLTVAEELKVKGLTQGNQGGKNQELVNTYRDGTPNTQKHIPRLTPSEGITATEKGTKVSEKQRIHKSIPQALVDNEVHENIPVKSEPQDTPPQPSYLVHEQGYQEQEVDEGAVALDDGYAVAESYEYQYEDTGHTRQTERGQGTNGPRHVQANAKQAVRERKVKHNFKAFAQAWQCEDCKTVFSSRKYAKEHMQDHN